MQKHRLSSVTLGLFFSQGLQSLIVDVGHHGCPTKKILDFKWSKKAEITLETISFLVKYFYQLQVTTIKNKLKTLKFI